MRTHHSVKARVRDNCLAALGKDGVPDDTRVESSRTLLEQGDVVLEMLFFE
jgi:hypothetical protein